MKANIHKRALLAAGKMYLSAQLVINANTLNLSQRVFNLQMDAENYNNEIIQLQKNEEHAK